jgi:hypothetical protein
MKKYNLEIFRNIEEDTASLKLTDETIELITKLAKLVGAPSYVKTPNFQKKNSRKGGGGRKTDWGLIRNFKVTVIEKKIEGIEAEMDIVREFLNKLTANTYNENLVKLKEKVEKIRQDSKNMMIICKYIFEIASSNIFYSELYATLYKDLISEFGEMKELCLKNFQNFLILFKKIEYVNPDDDYEKFCDMNEENDKRRATSKFFVNLMKKNIISIELMEEFINSLLQKLSTKIKQNNQIKICEEICENLSIILNGNLSYFNSDIKNGIKNITEIEKRLQPSLTNKIIFKVMDILES